MGFSSGGFEEGLRFATDGVEWTYLSIIISFEVVK